MPGPYMQHMPYPAPMPPNGQRKFFQSEEHMGMVVMHSIPAMYASPSMGQMPRKCLAI